MSHAEAAACGMNSDFQEAFEERCEWIQPVFDCFHIVRNFNDKVVGAVRKDEQKRLLERGDKAGAQALKKTRYILTSKRSTLQQKDREADAGKILSSGSRLFRQPEVRHHGGYEAKYDELPAENSLLFTIDLVKEQLRAAFAETSESAMARCLMDTIGTCKSTGNQHFLWFARLLERHFTGIIAHATYRISSGKIEGINNKIRTLRRQAYGIPDDEYFFLKVVDASYRPYVRNPKSHMVLHWAKMEECLYIPPRLYCHSDSVSGFAARWFSPECSAISGYPCGDIGGDVFRHIGRAAVGGLRVQDGIAFFGR